MVRVMVRVMVRLRVGGVRVLRVYGKGKCKGLGFRLGSGLVSGLG